MAENYRDRLFGFLKSRAVGQPGELFTEVPRERPSSAPLPADDLGVRFCSELNAVGGEASDLATSADPAAELGSWLQGLGLKTAVIDSDPGWKVAGLPIRELVEGAGLGLERVDGSARPADLAEFDLAEGALDGSIFRMLRQGQRVLFNLDSDERATRLSLGSEVDMGTPDPN